MSKTPISKQIETLEYIRDHVFGNGNSEARDNVEAAIKTLNNTVYLYGIEEDNRRLKVQVRDLDKEVKSFKNICKNLAKAIDKL